MQEDPSLPRGFLPWLSQSLRGWAGCTQVPCPTRTHSSHWQAVKGESKARGRARLCYGCNNWSVDRAEQKPYSWVQGPGH